MASGREASVHRLPAGALVVPVRKMPALLWQMARGAQAWEILGWWRQQDWIGPETHVARRISGRQFPLQNFGVPIRKSGPGPPRYWVKSA